jgi:N,N'-diacetylchitobiose transport system substrate-binding protein
MKGRTIAAAALAVAALSFAASAGGSVSGPQGRAASGTLTVWLQVDAQADNWAPIVAAANAEFERSHPGVKVNVQYQTWGTHLQKFDATLAGGNTPDVIEMGNTEMTKYMAAGAFADLTADKSKFDNNATWLAGLAASGRYGGKVFGVPYYAGSRVVTYRTDQWKQAAVKVPTSLADFQAAAAKLNAKFGSQKGYSPVYVAGTDWYLAMGFVFDHGGGIATTSGGRWKGLLATPKSLAGLTAYKNFFYAASKASKTTDETKPNPYDVMAQGQAGSIVGPAWFSCCVGKYKTSVAQFVIPSHEKGKVMPGFLGGSDLAVPIKSDNKALAVDWIRIYTNNDNMRKLQAIGNIPNTTSLVNAAKVNERAASRSWFVPTAKNWVNVENEGILRNMLAQILTKRLTVRQAAIAASDAVASILDAP